MADREQPQQGSPVARVLVAGASGYAGALAAELVWRHPRLQLVAATSRSERGERLSALYPRYTAPVRLTELAPDTNADTAEAAIVGYPHGASAPAVAALREGGVRVVDLSADFRLRELATYERWYGAHGAPSIAGEAVYGLTELNRERIAQAGLVANPGCYPTATLLALAPLAEAGLIDDVVVDAKSGASGAGRGKGEATTFTHVTENTFPYGVAGHRHSPEIAQELATLGATARLTFVPHLVALDQGELVSCYVTPTEPVGLDRARALYAERYDGERFVDLSEEPPGVRDVRETNRCRIHLASDDEGGRLLVFAAIDNLWKGAASQAVQNLNVMFGLPEDEGLG